MSDKAWWSEPAVNVGKALAKTVESLAISTAQKAREDRYLQYAQMYANQEIRTLREFEQIETEIDPIMEPRWSYNVCKAGADTIVSLIARAARIQVLANGGTRTMRQKAEMMTRYLDGVWWMTKYRKLSRLRLRDATVFDIGFIRWVAEGAQLRAERRFPWQILWHEQDGRDGTPTCLYDTARMPVEHAIVRYGLDEAAAQRVRKHASGTGHVWIDEGWQQPIDDIDPKDKRPKEVDPERVPANGRHTVHCAGEMIVDEWWPHRYFPVKEHVWDERPCGFSGQGVVEQLVPYQAEIHRVLNTMRANHRLGSVLRIAMEQ